MGHIIVVGGGAAGIIGAWRAATLGADVTLIEKTARLGTKILISGGGKCNITHDGDLKDVLKAFRKNEAEFIRPACYRFTNHMIVKLFVESGLKVYTRPDGRIFPTDGTAKDVVAILQKYLSTERVKIVYKSPVEKIVMENGSVTGVIVQGKFLGCDSVIVATGGSSYPNSGTTGDAWPWAKEIGHSIAKVHASLAPIYLFLDDPSEVLPPSVRSGISLRDVVLKARIEGKEFARWRGDLLLTHRGISGPCALGISREITERERMNSTSLDVDLLPDFSFEELQLKVRQWSNANPKKQALSFIEEYVPSRIAEAILITTDLTGGSALSQVAKRKVNRLIETLKMWQLGSVRAVPLELGEVVAGGISLNEVDPSTMGSRLCKGLYFCGEALDIAGPVGGYNLQAAFSTGYVAGESAALKKSC